MSAALWLLAGLAGGTAHFALLRWNTQLYLGGGALVHAVGVQLLRLVAIGLLLGFAAWHGAWPLLLAALGVMVARLLVVRRRIIAP
jgi:dolichyl-phosphate-mannose--protein O-mannosyl transferase